MAKGVPSARIMEGVISVRARDYHDLGAKLRADGWTTSSIIAQWASDGMNPREAARLSHGLTQQQAADEWNHLPDGDPDRPCTRKHISNWETSRQPGLDTLSRLARIYRCGAGDLLGGEDYSHLEGQRPHPGAAMLHIAICVVVDAGCVLVVRNRDGDFQFPSGMVKPNQDAADRAAEECAGETGIRVRVTDYLGHRIHPSSSASSDYFLAEYLTGEVANGQPGENSDVTWAPVDRLDKFIAPDRVFHPVRTVLEQHRDTAATH